MPKLTLTEAQRILLGIIESVEVGNFTAEEAVQELTELKADAERAGLNFRADYTLADFQKIREMFLSTNDSSTDPDGSIPYEPSTSY